jgi:hypothetical protein
MSNLMFVSFGRHLQYFVFLQRYGGKVSFTPPGLGTFGRWFFQQGDVP